MNATAFFFFAYNFILSKLHFKREFSEKYRKLYLSKFKFKRPFDKICQKHKIEHRTIKFKHPWTNGMVENFNKRIKDNVLKRYMFQSIIEMNGKLIEFINDYNQNKRLKSLNYKTPAQFLKEQKGISLQRSVI